MDPGFYWVPRPLPPDRGGGAGPGWTPPQGPKKNPVLYIVGGLYNWPIFWVILLHSQDGNHKVFPPFFSLIAVWFRRTKGLGCFPPSATWRWRADTFRTKEDSECIFKRVSWHKCVKPEYFWVSAQEGSQVWNMKAAISSLGDGQIFSGRSCFRMVLSVFERMIWFNFFW